MANSEYEFCGKHLIASYMSCNLERLSDHRGLDKAMREAIEASGATILEASTQVFPGAGLTSVYLLSESHASIHTYPEHSACFIDIFTCGFTCDPHKFDSVLSDYLQAGKVSRRILIRGESNTVDFEEDSTVDVSHVEPASVGA